MYPHERSLVKQLADKPFALVGVNSDDDLEEIRQIVKEKNLTWRSFQNKSSSGVISEQWNVTGWPTIYILDATGKIRYRNVRGRALDRALEKLLAEMGEEVKIVHQEEEQDDEKKDGHEEKQDQADPQPDPTVNPPDTSGGDGGDQTPPSNR